MKQIERVSCVCTINFLESTYAWIREKKLNKKKIKKNKSFILEKKFNGRYSPLHSTEVCFASFLSVGFITAIVVKPPERNLAKRTSVKSYILAAALI